jgi:hypothetical protein
MFQAGRRIGWVASSSDDAIVVESGRRHRGFRERHSGFKLPLLARGTVTVTVTPSLRLLNPAAEESDSPWPSLQRMKSISVI